MSRAQQLRCSKWPESDCVTHQASSIDSVLGGIVQRIVLYSAFWLQRRLALATFVVVMLVFGGPFVGTAKAQLQGASGNVRVNLTWDGNVDLDLYVTDPCGNIIGYEVTESAACRGVTGGRDHEDTGHGDETDNPNAENIVWENGAPVGRYRIHVDYFGGVDDATKYVVRIYLGNEERLHATHEDTIDRNHEGRKFVADFEADESVNLSVVSINTNAATIDEGDTATFRLTAEPPPGTPLPTTVTVSQVGDVVADGQAVSRTVTIGTNGIGTLSVETDDDAVDESNGTITVTVADGEGYAVSDSRGSASVVVNDNDSPSIVLSVTELTIDEGVEGAYAVRLATVPPGDVEVTPRSANPHIKFTPTSLTFDSDNPWDMPQQMSFRIEEDNESRSVTIRHEVSGYGDLTEGGTVTVSVVQPTEPPDAERKQSVERTVAGVAAAAVSNVSSNIGARFSAPSGGTAVSLAGRPVAFGSAARSQSAWTFADRVDPFDDDSRQSWQRTMSGSELLRSSSFEIALGAAEGSEGNAAEVGRQFTVWGRGDFQVFESGGGRNSGYDGDMVAGYLGADFTTDGSWLVGMAVSRIAAEADYTLGSVGGGGTIDAELTNLHPYLRVAVDERSEAWAILGFGKGEVTDTPRAAGASKSDLSMRMASAGLRRRLNTNMGIDLALLGDGSLAEITTDEGVEAVDGISASVWRARAGVEASYTSVWEGGSSLTSFVEVAARKDGGDSTEGVGLEVSPGLAFTNPESGFSVEARARALALHSADNHKEYGASITASLTPGSDGLGLSMAVAPTWGTPDNSLDSMEAGLFAKEAAVDRADSLSLNSRVSYGFAAGRGVLAPFAELSLDGGDRRHARIGSRYSLGPSVTLELSGDRMGGTAGSTEHGVLLRARVDF